MKIILSLILVTLFTGCAQIQRGHDPIVVNSERSLSVAFEAVDTFLRIEHDQRGWFRERAPSVHYTAESLRRRAPEAFTRARTAIKRYKAERVGESTVRKAVAVVTSLGVEASEALATVNTIQP